jgi:ribosomal protein S18 acetylase RimI-like enzyme
MVAETDLVVRPFTVEDQVAVIALWHECALVVPWNDPAQDIFLKLQVQPELFLVGLIGNAVIATVMAGYDGHRGWLNYLAVSPECQKRGVGRRMVGAAQTRLAAIGCPKINLQVRASNADVIAFYERLGFSQDNVVSLGKRLSPSSG